MADEKSTGASGKRVLTTYEEDERAQAVALFHVLELHPAVTFTRAELLVELSGGGAPGYLDADAIERALRELVAAGLLHRIGEDEMVRPTRAALRCWDLTERAS